MMKTGMRLWTLLPRGCNCIGERVLNDGSPVEVEEKGGEHTSLLKQAYTHFFRLFKPVPGSVSRITPSLSVKFYVRRSTKSANQ